MSKAILFLCLGNICRSPTAEAVFSARLASSPLAHKIRVDSAGTGDWHIGRAPDPRTQQAALRRGYDLSALRARQISPADFDAFDLIVAMDDANLDDALAMAPNGSKARCVKLLDFAPASGLSAVPDPYYGGEDGFDQVLDLVEQGVDGLLRHLEGEQQ